MWGKFVAIEGGDAGGKNTQSKLLAEKLDALLISFPRYETEIGKLISASLRGELRVMNEHDSFAGARQFSDAKAANAIVRQALFTLDRYDAAPLIASTLESGRSVVADRYWLSGVMYGSSDFVDSGMLERVHQCLPQPDVWVLLDVPVEESFRRRPERQDVYERDREKLEGIRRRYLERFGLPGSPLNYTRSMSVLEGLVVVNGLGTVEEVHNRIMGVI